MDSESEEAQRRQEAVISAALDRMWIKFLPDLRERVRVLDEAAWEAARGPLGEEQCREAQGAAHKLAGSLGLFGLDRGTELARELEACYALGGVGPSQAEALAGGAREIRLLIEARKAA